MSANTLAPAGPGTSADVTDEPFRISATQFAEMEAAGILRADDRLELLDGVIYRRVIGGGQKPYEMNPPHAIAVEALAEYKPAVKAQGCHLRVQTPLNLSDADVPHPDAAVVRGRLDDYRDGHPSAADVLYVVEIADSSLARDRRLKLARYAAAGLPVYVIVNLRERVAEVHSEPSGGRYRRFETLAAEDTLRLPTAGEPVAVPLVELLGA